jgi:hypothetical protein
VARFWQTKIALVGDNGIERARLNDAAQRPHYASFPQTHYKIVIVLIDATLRICNLARKFLRTRFSICLETGISPNIFALSPASQI